MHFIFNIELWDVGGSHSHRNSRHVFYSNFHGIILVHDLANRKSQQNLEKWLHEVLERLVSIDILKPSVRNIMLNSFLNFFGNNIYILSLLINQKGSAETESREVMGSGMITRHHQKQYQT